MHPHSDLYLVLLAKSAFWTRRWRLRLSVALPTTRGGERRARSRLVAALAVVGSLHACGFPIVIVRLSDCRLGALVAVFTGVGLTTHYAVLQLMVVCAAVAALLRLMLRLVGGSSGALLGLMAGLLARTAADWQLIVVLAVT